MTTGPSTAPTTAERKVSFLPGRVDSFATLFALAAPHRSTLVLATVALACGSGINLLFPEIVRRLLDPTRLEFIAAHQVVIVTSIAGLCVVQGIVFFLRSYLFGLLGQRVYADLRGRLFQAVLDKEIAFFDATRASELASRINSDAALIQEAISAKSSVLIRYGIQIVVGILLMVSISLALTVALVLSVLVIVGVSGLFIRHLKTASRSYQSELSRFTSFASECFSGVKIIRALGGEQGLSKTASMYNRATLMAGNSRVGWSASFSSGVSALLNVLLLLVLSYGLMLVGSGSLPMNELAAFVLYGGIVAVSFSFFASAYAEVMQSMGGLERVFELLSSSREGGTDVHHESSYTDPVALHAVPSGRERESTRDGAAVGVVFHEVSFAYPSRDSEYALNSFSCCIEPGLTTALVGPSGAGKSSVAQLLCGLYAPTRGTISLIIEGQSHPLSELLKPSLKRLVSWVPQEPQLFGFSVLENLLLGNSTLMRDEVVKTIRSWGFLDFVDSLDRGIDTVLGEHGASLSGGQRQRIAIARALLRKPGLLVLDEATSGLDSETEASVMSAIRQYIPGATLLVISHRLATVHRADAIIVMQDGRVVEQGTHASLVQANGLYRQYSDRQLLGNGTP